MLLTTSNQVLCWHSDHSPGSAESGMTTVMLAFAKMGLLSFWSFTKTTSWAEEEWRNVKPPSSATSCNSYLSRSSRSIGTRALTTPLFGSTLKRLPCSPRSEYLAQKICLLSAHAKEPRKFRSLLNKGQKNSKCDVAKPPWLLLIGNWFFCNT